MSRRRPSTVVPEADAALTPVDRPERHVVFALMATAMLIYNMQYSMVAVGLDALTTDLHAPLRWSGWVLTVFLLGMVVSLPVAGRFAERFGARAVFAGGFVLFTLSSLICAVAPNVFVLILGRLGQGVAGGGLVPAGVSLIGEVYANGRTRAIGLYAAMMPGAAVLGPVVGGVVVATLGWRATFALTVPIGALASVLAFFILPPGQRRPVQRTDGVGIVLLAVIMTSFIFALTELGRRDAPADMRVVVGSFLLCAVALVLFLRQESRFEVPVVDLDLLRRPPFAATYLISMAFGAGWQGIVAIVPLYAQQGYRQSIEASGALSGPRGLVMVGCAALSAMLLQRTGFRKPILLGVLGLGAVMWIISLGIANPTIAGVTLSNFWWLLLIVSSAGIFYGLATPSLQNAGLELAPTRIATLAGLRGMFNSLGGTIGIAVAVMITSRSSDTVVGLQHAFAAIGALVALSAICVPWIPELGIAKRTGTIALRSDGPSAERAASTRSR